jgi:hypothetical protein
VKDRFKELMKAEHSSKDSKNGNNDPSKETAKEPDKDSTAKQDQQKGNDGAIGAGKKDGEERGAKCTCQAHATTSGGGRQEGSGMETVNSPKRLRPDSMWSRGDCEILEMLHERYYDQQWLVVQSGFYNLTGRMIVGQHIANKLKELD